MMYAYTVADNATAFLAMKTLEHVMSVERADIALLEDHTKPPKIAPSGPRC